MSICKLSDRQKDLLRSIVPGLKDGSVKTQWGVSSSFKGVLIIGLPEDGNLYRNVWMNNVKSADFDVFVECGFFLPKGTDAYILIEQAIIDAVESNFGDERSSSQLATVRGNQKVRDQRTVFVVHGRNEPTRIAFFAFLRSIGLTPLEWSEVVRRTGKPTPYIGEVLDTAFSEAQAIVVLMTPDDIARLLPPYQHEDDELYEKNLTPQARPNVLFEAGIAMGRSPERTVLVQVGKIRPFSDIAGRHLVLMDNSTQKRQELAHRLVAAGCQVDLNGTDWHKTGDFRIDAQYTLEQEPSNDQWGKSGNLWWLALDLMSTWGWIDRGSKDQIQDGLKRCHHHAVQLGMNDRNIIERLRLMMSDVDGYSDPDLTRSLRDQFLRRLESIRNDAGQAAQSKQAGFKPDPD